MRKLLALVVVFALSGCREDDSSSSNQDSFCDNEFQITHVTKTNRNASYETVDVEYFREGTNLVFTVECLRSAKDSKFFCRKEKLYVGSNVVANIITSSFAPTPSINTSGAQGIDISASVNKKGKFTSVSASTDDFQILAACTLKNGRLRPVSASTLAKQNSFTQNLSSTFKGFIETQDKEEFQSNIEQLKEEAKAMREGH